MTVHDAPAIFLLHQWHEDAQTAVATCAGGRADGSADCLTFFVLGRGLEELLCWSAPFSVSLSTYLGCAGGCAGQTWRNPHAKEFGCRCITFTWTCRIGCRRIRRRADRGSVPQHGPAGRHGARSQPINQPRPGFARTQFGSRILQSWLLQTGNRTFRAGSETAGGAE